MRRMRKIETTIPSTFVDVSITFIIMIMENGSNINKNTLSWQGATTVQYIIFL